VVPGVGRARFHPRLALRASSDIPLLNPDLVPGLWHASGVTSGSARQPRGLGRLKPVELRDVWSHEALELTPWLLENDDVLSEVLGIDLELTASEHPVGPFAVDLLGQDLTNDCVLIVENQLGPTDHDHLGKLVTYTAGTDARTVVWLAPVFREEHRQALDFLNEIGGERVRFFGIELAAVRIGDSPPAPMMTLRVQPNDWHAQVSLATRAVTRASGRAELYREFWAKCVTRVKQVHPGWTKSRAPGGASWIALPAPFKGLSVISFCFGQGGRLRVELYVDASEPAEVVTLYETLLAHMEEVETAYGGPLSWEALPGSRASRICVYRDGSIEKTSEQAQYIDWFVEHGGRLRSAFRAVAQEIHR
jgi:hypothetical protein